MGVQWRIQCKVAVHPSEQDAQEEVPETVQHPLCMCIPRNRTGYQVQSPLALCCAHISFLVSCQIIQRSPSSGTTLTLVENCNPPSNSCGLGFDIVNNIGRVARIFGSVTTFRAYLDVSVQSSKPAVTLRSDLQSSGVSMIDCPHNGRKDVVDKMILVDMLAFAVDHPAPATIVLITGDRDYAYAVSILKLRNYQVILVTPSSRTLPCLESQASLVIDWNAAALRTRTEPANSTQAVRQPYLDLDATLTAKLLREVQGPSLDDPDTTLHPYPTASQSASRPRRMSVRDLLEPSRHSKNTASSDSTQELTHNPASPRKYSSTGSDSAHGELPIPKTPSRSRSRHASVSTESTRTCSATMVAQSPPAVEQDIPGKNPPPSHARRSSPSDLTDVASPAKRSPSVLPLLDVLELPLHDSCPPSSIIVPIPSSPKLSCLASPFVTTKAPTGLESIPNASSEQPHTTARPTSPIVTPTETFADTVTIVVETPQMKSIGVPKEIEHLTGLPIEDLDGNCEWSLPHRAHLREGARDATHTPKSNYYSHVGSYTTYSPSSRNVGLHLPDTPSSKRVSPSGANSLGVGDGIDSAQFAASPRASNTPDHFALGSESMFSSTAFPSTPFTTTELHEMDERELHQTWTIFEPLINLLLAARESGITRPSRSIIATSLLQFNKRVYQRAGVQKFRDYTALAERAGIIELGHTRDDPWIALHPNWFRVDGITRTHSPPNRVPSPTSDPPNAIQSPLLTSYETPPDEGAAIFQTPTSASPERRSSKSSSAPPALPTRRQDSPSIPARFQPLIDILIHMRTAGFPSTLRSIVVQSLCNKGVYAQAGVSGFGEYICQASEAQLVLVGGEGSHAWIRLHPELRV
ncbi:hypothetical protein J3R82DRAFT_5589 [Butyriboletus roseoflavus]|nr:hypothetical protein J3R82DRAFT_5589 [Butyriboletus roseoflavus]